MIDKENTIIQEQTPKAEIIVNKGSKIYVKIKYLKTSLQKNKKVYN